MDAPVRSSQLLVDIGCHVPRWHMAFQPSAACEVEPADSWASSLRGSGLASIPSRASSEPPRVKPATSSPPAPPPPPGVPPGPRGDAAPPSGVWRGLMRCEGGAPRLPALTR
eukprot:scaffold131344_cov60-Phaeocystis_antarctica.AAC.2